MFMYKYVHNQAADCGVELFTRTNELHNGSILHTILPIEHHM